MRRKLLLGALAIASMLVLATGCAKAEPDASIVNDAGRAKSEPSVLSEKDAGRAIEVVAGQQLSVRLSSNRTTGFGWVVADAGPLKQSGESTYEASQTPAGVVGAGGTERFTFTSGAAGSGTLKLEYLRPWEKRVPAEKTWEVTVTVK